MSVDKFTSNFIPIENEFSSMKYLSIKEWSNSNPGVWGLYFNVFTP